MPTRKPSTPKRPSGLPEQLPKPEVLLGCFYRLTVAAYTDRPAELEATLRASIPAKLSAAEKRAAAKPLLGNIGVVHRSEKHDCLWFKQGSGSPYRVDPSRLTEEQRTQVSVAEPKRAIRDGHTAGLPYPPPAPEPPNVT